MDTLELRKNLWEEVLGYHQQNNFACLNYWSTLVKDRKNVRCLYIYIYFFIVIILLLSYWYYTIINTRISKWKTKDRVTTLLLKA